MPRLKENPNDSLTSLPTFDTFRREVRVYADNIQKEGKTPALLFFNIENMKNFNLHYGYTEGDILLSHVAIILKNNFSEGIVCRYGEDHFAAVAEKDNIGIRIDGIAESINAMEGHNEIRLKTGIADYKELIEKYDIREALDLVKSACDSISHDDTKSFRFFDEELKKKADAEHFIQTEFSMALDMGLIKAYFQPIIHTMSGKLCALEALSRWEDPLKGIIYPGHFLPTLEKFSLAEELDLYMSRLVCSTRKSPEYEPYSNIPISVNFSAKDFFDDMFPEKLNAITRDFGIPEELFIIEVTEDYSAMNKPEFIENIKILKGMGYKIALDGFASGYYPINVMSDGIFDIMKFDRVYLNRFQNNTDTEVLLADLIASAKRNNVITLFEGVKTAEECSMLREIGCEMIQGFVFSEPVTLDQFAVLTACGELPEPESEEEYEYIRNVGSINYEELPVDEENDFSLSEASSQLPTAIIEYNEKHDTIRYMSRNVSFKKNFGFVDLIAEENAPAKFLFSKIKEYDSLTNSWIDSRFEEGGNTYVLSMKKISDYSSHKKKAFLTVWLNVSFLSKI